MAGNQQFCLRWNNHQSTLISVFDNLLESGTLVDCTLAAEGQYLKAHKVVLSACSPFFEGVFSQHYEKHPIIILKDVTFSELKAMLDYMYRGEVNISQEQLGTFLKAAESLQIKGLTESGGNGDLKREQRKIPPLFPQGLVVEQRAPLPPSQNRILNNSNINNNNNDSPPPPVYPPQQPPSGGAAAGGPCLSPKRRKRRSSDETLTGGWMSAGGGTPDGAAATPGGGGLGMKKEEAMSDSGGEGPYDFEDDEEVDLSKPGTSAANSHPSGVWNADSQSDEAFTLPGGSQEQVSDKDDSEDRTDEPTDRQTRLTVASGAQTGAAVAGAGGGAAKVASPNARTMSSYVTWDLWASMQSPLLKGSLSPSGYYAGSDGVECNKCGRHYKLKSSLRNHQKWECGKEPQFKCPYCNYRAKQKMHVARHIERMHREKLDMLELREQALNLKQENEIVP